MLRPLVGPRPGQVVHVEPGFHRQRVAVAAVSQLTSRCELTFHFSTRPISWQRPQRPVRPLRDEAAQRDHQQDARGGQGMISSGFMRGLPSLTGDVPARPVGQRHDRQHRVAATWTLPSTT